MNHVTHPLSSADISIFSQKKIWKSANFAMSRNTDIDSILTQFIILLTFLESLLLMMTAILMMSAKMATPTLVKIKVF